MASNTAEPTTHHGYKRKSLPAHPRAADYGRRNAGLLYFPLAAKVLRTPFRAKTLQTIYDIAYRELGDKIEYADVFVDSDYYEEPERVALSLTIWADLDQDGWVQANQNISQSVFELEASFTEEERADFIDKIDFVVLPTPSSLISA